MASIKKGVIFITVLLLVIGQIGCTPGTDRPEDGNAGNDKPVKGGKLIFAGTEAKTFNPVLNSDRDSYYFFKLIFESLVDYDESLKIKPVLAEEWEATGGGNAYDFYLKKGVKWHDGTEFTSEDVIFTLEYLKYLKEKNQESIYTDNIDRITYFEAVDDYHVKVVFDQSFNGILDIMTFPVLPSHLLGSPEILAAGETEFPVVGTGPYKEKEYRKLKYMTLEANPDWWGGEPYISEIEMRFVVDEATALTSFKSDQVDMVVTTYPDWDRFGQSGEAVIKEFVTTKYDFVGLNFKNPIFGDKQLRRAIQMGMDRDRIIEKIYLKHAVKVDAPIPPYSWLYSEDGPSYGYDPEKAKEILREGGWMDRDNDGILEKEIDGIKRDLSFTLMVNSDNPKRLEAAKIIMDNLKNIGMEVDLQELTWEQVNDKVFKKEFDAVVLGWNLAKYLDLSFAFHSKQIEEGSNFISFSSQEFDSLLQKDFRAVDQETRKATSSEVQKYIREELPYNSLYFKTAALLAKKRVKGSIEPGEHNIFLNVDKWYIPESLQ